MIKKLEIANKLKNEIRELKWFIEQVNCYDENQATKHSHLKLILNVKKDTKFRILGSRWFGCGSQTSDIEIPNTLAFKIRELAKKELENKTNELNNIIR